ncbi:MAG: hypothetical protein GWQ05_20860 [Verrucomicrobiaceae bacterium]|jgi:hypothetical protein|nr:hypothetical protein [Verrucomicrobiaceae bacterium]
MPDELSFDQARLAILRLYQQLDIQGRLPDSEDTAAAVDEIIERAPEESEDDLVLLSLQEYVKRFDTSGAH